MAKASVVSPQGERDYHNPDVVSAKTITISEFKEKLGKYPELIKTLTKPKKAGQLTLEELDQFRYVDALAKFSIKGEGKIMELDDVKKLVDWKMRHGQFRPALPKLVASNAPTLVTSTLTTAFTMHASNPSNLIPTITKLASLRGIRPATASLILSIHDPENVVFFSDGVFRWLVGGGERVAMAYTAKEYDVLVKHAREMRERLGVSMVEIERVAYVVMKENEPEKGKKEKGGVSGKKVAQVKSEKSEKEPEKAPSGRARGRPKAGAKVEVDPKADGNADVTKSAAKGKRKADVVEHAPKSTRSKRSKA